MQSSYMFKRTNFWSYHTPYSQPHPHHFQSSLTFVKDSIHRGGGCDFQERLCHKTGEVSITFRAYVRPVVPTFLNRPMVYVGR